MAQIRLIHSQSQDGDLLINDIEDGTPRRPFDDYYKQDVYVTFNRKFFNGDGLVEVDETQPGFIDLVPSDDVLLSREDGVIAGLEAAGLITVVDVATGALAAPTIATADQDTSDATDATNDYRVEIAGTNLVSVSPDVSTVVLTAANSDTVTLTATAIDADPAGTFTATSIIIPATLHGFATDDSNNVTDVAVTANKRTATAAVAEI